MGVCLDESGFSQRRNSDEAISEGHAAPSVFPGKWLCVFLRSPGQAQLLSKRRPLHIQIVVLVGSWMDCIACLHFKHRKQRFITRNFFFFLNLVYFTFNLFKKTIQSFI